jgi:hypothetical protein
VSDASLYSYAEYAAKDYLALASRWAERVRDGFIDHEADARLVAAYVRASAFGDAAYRLFKPVSLVSEEKA